MSRLLAHNFMAGEPRDFLTGRFGVLSVAVDNSVHNQWKKLIEEANRKVPKSTGCYVRSNGVKK